jgi:hypothetical protein
MGRIVAIGLASETSAVFANPAKLRYFFVAPTISVGGNSSGGSMAIDNTSDDTGSYDIAEDEALPIPALGAPGAIAAAPALPAAMCAVCKTPIVNQYYLLGTAKVCPNCSAIAGGAAGGFVRFLKSTGLGILGGLLGAAVWFGVRRASGYEIGLVAILVGFLVGYGVLVGSGRRGGRGYQILAIMLTYLAIALNYMPDIYTALDKKAREQQHAQPANVNPGTEETVRKVLVVVITVPITLAAPVLNGFDNPISLVIGGIAMWEAWKINRIKSAFKGPFGFNVLPPPVGR